MGEGDKAQGNFGDFAKRMRYLYGSHRTNRRGTLRGEPREREGEEVRMEVMPKVSGKKNQLGPGGTEYSHCESNSNHERFYITSRDDYCSTRREQEK